MLEEDGWVAYSANFCPYDLRRDRTYLDQRLDWLVSKMMKRRKILGIAEHSKVDHTVLTYKFVTSVWSWSLPPTAINKRVTHLHPHRKGYYRVLSH